jgi:hypothetical protein
MNAAGVTVTILIDGSVVHTDTIGALNVNASSSQTYDAATASLALGTHAVTFRVNSTTECSSPNNEVSTTFNVGSSSSPVCGNSIIETGEACDTGNLNNQTCISRGFIGGVLTCTAGCAFNTTACATTPGPFCGDATCNNGETCSTCPGDCGTCHSGGGGGGGGGSHGGNLGARVFILDLTPEHPTETLPLRNGDTVKFLYNLVDYSFIFRSITISKTEMGLSATDSYKTFEFYTGVTYNLNLDNKSAADLGVKTDKTYIGYGNYTFTLLGVEKKPLFTLPFFNKKPRVAEANQTADVASGTEEPQAEEESLSEGVLNFVETLTVRDSAPFWKGLA